MTNNEKIMREALEKYGRHSTPEHHCASMVHSDNKCDCGLDEALAASALPQSNVMLPDGWRLIPVEPTADMLSCMMAQNNSLDKWYGALACAPHHPCTDTGDGVLRPSAPTLPPESAEVLPTSEAINAITHALKVCMTVADTDQRVKTLSAAFEGLKIISKLLAAPESAWQDGRKAGLEEAADLCDKLYEGERGVWICIDEVASKIRALIDTPPKVEDEQTPDQADAQMFHELRKQNPLPPKAESPWQDISTAPRDGSKFIGYSPSHGIRTGVCWEEKRQDFDLGFSSLLRDWTHWMPLPPKPEGAK